MSFLRWAVRLAASRQLSYRAARLLGRGQGQMEASLAKLYAARAAEQVTRDVISSAFQSSGQRCSALRVLFVQEDVADAMIRMIAG